MDIVREEKFWGYPTYIFPTEGKQGVTLSSCISSPAVNKCPFHSLISAIFFKNFVPFADISLLRMAPHMILSVT